MNCPFLGAGMLGGLLNEKEDQRRRLRVMFYKRYRVEDKFKGI
ncbi:hypothetical protein SAMN05421807_11134 [Virgibacillus chiguensis]|uniref:Uncharacterized protein n=1 Tax=Virgibacillus chiguensis TaxID=411959 RepID=A0A1M5V024_9BACI|nr:hypothetical protein SAMN05421807_11134 [Virgibacillus chiguensis]